MTKGGGVCERDRETKWKTSTILISVKLEKGLEVDRKMG